MDDYAKEQEGKRSKEQLVDHDDRIGTLERAVSADLSDPDLSGGLQAEMPNGKPSYLSMGANRGLWEIFERTTTTCKIRAYDDGAAYVGGALKAITDGANCVCNGPPATECVITFDATHTHVWVAIDRDDTGGTPTITCGSAFPAPDDDTEIFPLHKVTWSTDHVDWSTHVPYLGRSLHWVAGA